MIVFGLGSLAAGAGSWGVTRRCKTLPMRYALLICNDETSLPSYEEMNADPVNQAWSADLERRRAELYGARLRPIARPRR